MSRDGREDEREWYRDPALDRPELPSGPSVERSRGGSSSSIGREREAPDPHPIDRRPSDRREPFRWRQRTISLRESEARTLQTIGTFRVVRVSDLERFAYSSNDQRLQADLRALEREGLIKCETHPAIRGGALRVLTLSRDGHAIATRINPNPRQVLYPHGVRPGVVSHDAALYRVYLAEEARLERAGGIARRVVLEAELKGVFSSERHRTEGGLRGADRDVLREQHALMTEAYHLRVVDGVIQIPDLRIEYDNAEGERTRVDVEVATGTYTLTMVANKARAGFRIYAPRSRAESLRAALEDRGIVTEILSL